ncbi:MAG: TIGR02450 family Trp-rich protein [Pseudomonadota bacterium]
MHPTLKRVTHPKKLLNSKWSAVKPTLKEKHFVVIKLIMPDPPDQAIEYVELEAIYSKRVQRLPWKQLNDTSIWQQGWV